MDDSWFVRKLELMNFAKL